LARNTNGCNAAETVILHPSSTVNDDPHNTNVEQQRRLTEFGGNIFTRDTFTEDRSLTEIAGLNSALSRLIDC
jgi:hypothetical protein